MSHYKPYPAYKDSGVEWIGRVPEHWGVKAFKRLASIRNGQDYKDVADPGGAYPVIGSGGEFARASSFMFDGESVLLGRKGTIDKPLYINGPFWTVDTMFYTTIADDAFPRFVYYSALTIPFGLYSTNTALPSMTGEDISSHVIAVPEFAEQKAIARGLDRETACIDALIAAQRRLIDLLREKRSALISHVVTKGLDPNVEMKDSGVEWLGTVPGHWDVCKLSYRYTVELGKMLDEKKFTGNQPVSYLRNKDVQWQSINTVDLPTMDISPSEIDRYTIKNGDLLVCEGGDVGRAAIWRGADNVIGYQKALHRLRAVSASKDSVEFYFFALFAAKNNGVFEESDTKSTISHLPAEKFCEYRFAFPPIDEQQAIFKFLATMIKRIDLLFEKTQRSIDLLKERRSALITATVTGQIDIRDHSVTIGVI